MPRFRVVERRCFDVEYLIDAPSVEQARSLDGEIVEESGGVHGAWGEEIVSVEEVEDEAGL